MPVEVQFPLGLGQALLPPHLRVSTLLMALLLSLAVLFSPVSSQEYNRTELYVVWNYPSPASDFGFSYSLDRARLDLEAIFEPKGTLRHPLLNCFSSNFDSGSLQEGLLDAFLAVR